MPLETNWGAGKRITHVRLYEMNDGPYTVASIEARTASSRLPGKMLADLGGVTTIALLIRRLRLANTLDGIVVATTDTPEDDVLAEIAASEGVPVYRGSEENVLGRVTYAQRMMNSEIVVALCGDCPLIDPAIVDRAVRRFLKGDCDLVTTTAPQSFPQGMDVDVFAWQALQQVASKISDPVLREHVTLYFHENLNVNRIVSLRAPGDLAKPDQRLQLDYPEDLQVLRAIHRALNPIHGMSYTLADILTWLDANREIRDLNQHCRERSPR